MTRSLCSKISTRIVTLLDVRKAPIWSKSITKQLIVATDAAHCSFALKNAAPDARPRESIEVRAMVFTYPEE